MPIRPDIWDCYHSPKSTTQNKDKACPVPGPSSDTAQLGPALSGPIFLQSAI
ncbi:MAG: hypothetical protein ACI8YI_002089 [Paracoccaceae bacterium]